MPNNKSKYRIKVEHVVFDTADCDVYIDYDKARNHLAVTVTSSLGKIARSDKEWIDESSYGMCTLETKDLDTLREIADAILDKQWLWGSGNKKTPFEDESIKRDVLKQLHDARVDLPDFVAEKLKEGGFDDITDSEGWTNLSKFIERLNHTYHLHIPRALMLDLPNVDRRILIKAPAFEKVYAGTGCHRYHRDPDKFFITYRE
ncbi:MAG: hypothetical protein NC094_11205 [Bacteroidales bacterium]|nr:hypothetical protein [Lachnoclostridium sp.]MCM1385341.1 hypothetical protein [Lachnoclostridium sp.]MCM1465976.1 hypothetical protein [Bacteroidales bacterium]